MLVDRGRDFVAPHGHKPSDSCNLCADSKVAAIIAQSRCATFVRQMRRLLAFSLFLIAACSADNGIDNAPEWLHVLHHKKAAVAPSATPRDKQVYADSLAAFVRKHPAHPRAREVYQSVQLEFARELTSLAQSQAAIRLYGAMLSSEPMNAASLRSPSYPLEHLVSPRQKLMTLQQSMS